MKTVAELRREGCKLKVYHERATEYVEKCKLGFEIRSTLLPSNEAKQKQKEGSHRILSKGGRTTIFLTDPSGKEFYASTKCSKKDGFCYRRGVGVCLGRVLKEMGA